MLIALGMLALLAALSFPSFAESLRRSRLSGSSSQIIAEIRYARSLAVSRGGFYGVHLGRDDAAVGAAYKNSYRTESSADGTTWPDDDAAMGSDPSVITSWQDVARSFTDVTIQSAGGTGGPIFNTLGASVDPWNGMNPRSVTITLADQSGATMIIQVSPTGNVRTL
jgi:type II secretory pathway pseudopilin PulG